MDDDTDIPLGAYLREWLDRRRAELRPSTLRCYRQTIACYLLPHLGEVGLGELDRRLLERHYLHLLDRGGRGGGPLSPRTVQLTHAVLHRALRDAQLDGLLDNNPAELARTPRRDPHEVETDEELQVWDSRQVAAFLALVDGHPWRTLWHLALGTGARRSELLGLRWRDVDLGTAQVTIRRGLTVVDGVARLLQTKTSRARTLSVGSSVVEAMHQRRTQQEADRQAADGAWSDRFGLVLTEQDGRHLDPMGVTREFRRLVRASDLPVIRLHDLRHTHASLLLEQGVTAKVVSDRLGHTTIAMTMDIYAHLLPAMDQDAAARLEQAVHGSDA